MIVTQICACGILMTVGDNACAREDARDAARRGRNRESARAIPRLRSCRWWILHEAERGVGVMATCNNIVDSYCFVIGPCNATRRVASASSNDAAAPNILRGRSFYWKFPAAHFGISAIFPFAWRTWRRGAFAHSLSIGAHIFALFFLIPFCIFFRASDIV